MTRPRVHLIDFETAIQDFAKGSPPSSRRCTGTPMEDSTYIRPWAPEISSNESYFPFILDMWQFGIDLQGEFPVGFSSFEFKNSLDGPG